MFRKKYSINPFSPFPGVANGIADVPIFPKAAKPYLLEKYFNRTRKNCLSNLPK